MISLYVFYSIALKNLLETVLAVGNFLNGGTETGQADGFNLDILNRLKEIQDWVTLYVEALYYRTKILKKIVPR